MARSWFNYTKTDFGECFIASSYSAIMGEPNCPLPNPVNICAILATVSITQPVLTLSLRVYLAAAIVSIPVSNQPVGPGVKKYVLVKAQ